MKDVLFEGDDGAKFGISKEKVHSDMHDKPKKKLVPKFNIILFEGTDTIKFGMMSEEIQSILKVKPECSKSLIGYDEEYYSGICRVLYEPNKNDISICAEIEFYKPVKVFLDGVQLMGKPIKEVADFFKSRFEDYSYDIITRHRSAKYGIGFSGTDNPHRKDIVQIVDISRVGFREAYQKAYDEKYSSEEISKEREYECIFCKATYISGDPNIKCPKCNSFLLPKV
ncbi:MAG: hypothetical protein N3I35_18655 [Clostridia bacterium]|nr:hypothetical protein [Clostridia bacterium]